MDDSRRFLRYVIPGLVYLLSMVLFVWILFPGWTATQLARVLGEQFGLGSAIAGLVASGGLGYVFSALHHLMHNRVGWLAPMDYSLVLNRLVASGQIQIGPLTTGERRSSAPSFSRREALPIITALWHQRTRTSLALAGIEARLNLFHDTAHASGTARIAVGAARYSRP
jgi:hypothetical protein